MLDRLNDRLRFVMTATAVIVGAAFATYRYADFLDLDVNFESYSAPQGKRFGGDCYYATAPWAEGQTFAGARTTSHAAKTTHPARATRRRRIRTVRQATAY